MVWTGILESLSDDIADILAVEIDREKIARHLTNIRRIFILPEDVALEVVASGKNIDMPTDLLDQIEETLEILDRPDDKDFVGRLITSLQEMVLTVGELGNLEDEDVEEALKGNTLGQGSTDMFHYKRGPKHFA